MGNLSVLMNTEIMLGKVVTLNYLTMLPCTRIGLRTIIANERRGRFMNVPVILIESFRSFPPSFH
jgi:hypothetical protein